MTEPGQHEASRRDAQAQDAPAQQAPTYILPPPPPGFYYPTPVPMPIGTLGELPRRTAMTSWAFWLSITALLLPVLGFTIFMTNRWDDGLVLLSRVMLVSTPVVAILGVIFSSIAMSKRYTRRGLAIAGLVISIITVVLVLLVLVGALTAIS